MIKPCSTMGCPNRVRTGLVRSGGADGRTCFKCRKRREAPVKFTRPVADHRDDGISVTVLTEPPPAQRDDAATLGDDYQLADWIREHLLPHAERLGLGQVDDVEPTP